ncbi:MAG: copper-translocating P-type ATPase [Balneolales bacterium]
MNHNHSHQEDGHAGHAHHDASHDHHAHMLDDFKKRFTVSLLIAIPILLLSPMIQEWLGLADELRFPGDLYVLFLLSTFVYFWGGWPFLTGLIDELKGKQPGMMTLIGLAITVAYVYSTAVVFGLDGHIIYWELATLIAIMLAGHWIEMRSIMSASGALQELAKLLPSDAHKIMDDGSTKDVPINKLGVGDKILIKPGEKIPADGEVTDGESNVNESMLTGESKPVSKTKGEEVIGGSVNEQGSLTIKINKAGDDSYLSQVMKLVQEAQESKSRAQDLGNYAAFWLTLIALSAGLITFLAWFIIMPQDLAFSIERTVTVMVITCPHALGLAIPLVISVSTSIAAGNGFIIRNRTSFEQARNIQAVIFDKTGTLTEGKFGVTDILNFSDNEYSDDDILKYAAAVESRSEHPIAKGIVEEVGHTEDVKNFNSLSGKGVEAKVGGKDIKVMNAGYVRDQNIELPDEHVSKLTKQGKTVVFVLIDDQLKGAIALGDQIRPKAREAIANLNDMGLQCMMLTGDNQQTAEYVAGELGLDDVFAEVLPDQKAEKIKEVQSRGLLVAMVGDGVNDAPALAQADTGIAIGAGSDVAIETGDIVLSANNPVNVADLIRLSRLTYRKMLQNLAWATGYNIFAIPLAAGVLFTYGIILSPAVGAVLMSLSTVIVAVNARLLKMD